MKTLILALMLATATVAQAQQTSPLPKTVKVTNNATGKVIGTLTINGNTVYYRDLKGKHIVTVVYDRDGKPAFYDESGKPVDGSTVPEFPND